jgi:tRNA pseudouridine38-40 synthase
VHALGQVISFSVDWRHGREDLQNALNAHLQQDIVILQLNQVPASFHPRFQARKRVYRYQIFNADQHRSPTRRLYSWHVRRPLDIVKMNKAAQQLIGQHDFATFGQPPKGTNTVRTVFAAEWQRQGPELQFSVAANAFLQRMVRSLVGSLKLVGDGTWTVADFAAAFTACERSKAGKTAPAQGLTLISVIYDGQFGELFDALGDLE